MTIRNLYISVMIATLLAVECTWPCGPDFPSAVVWQNNGDVLLKLPQVHFSSELEFHYGIPVDPEIQSAPDQLEIEVNEVLEVLAARSVPEERSPVVAEAYRQIRLITRGFTNPAAMMDDYSGARLDPPATSFVPPHAAPAPGFDFAVFAPWFKNLPDEFGLYAEGAAFYHLGYFDRAIERWQTLLDLPAAERQYRGVWAAYMRGKALLDINTAATIPAFERARTLAAEGSSDPLSLRLSSLGWQAHAEARKGDFKNSIHHYIEQFRGVAANERPPNATSIGFVCAKMLSNGQAPENLLQDALCREVVTLWALSRRGRVDQVKEWAAAMAANPTDQPVAQAGRLAHLYYDSGDMESARQWVEMAEAGDSIAQWIKSKLLLRAGKSAEAEMVLAGLKTALDKDPAQAPSLVSWNNLHWSRSLPLEVANNLGALRLENDNYAGAMEVFLEAGSVFDATYIAEQVMTAEELEAFLSAHPGEYPSLAGDEAYWQPISTAELLRYLLARKLARAGEFTRARPYYPEMLTTHLRGPREEPMPLREMMDAFADAQRRSKDKSKGKRAQAEGMMDTAMIARKWGMELIGTEHAPDWRVFDGVYEPDAETRFVAGTATAMEANRIADNTPSPNQRFHYRAMGPVLMWEAATKLPDNDERTAQALWYGGRWLIPLEGDADKYFKALVKRCRKLPVGQAADERNWFPPRPTSWGELEPDGTLKTLAR